MRGSSAAHSPDCPSGGPGRSLGSCTSGDSSRRAWAQGPGEASSPAWGPPGVLRTSWPGLWVTVLCSPPKPFPQPESMTLGTPCLSEQGWPPSHREQVSFCSSARDSPCRETGQNHHGRPPSCPGDKPGPPGTAHSCPGDRLLSRDKAQWSLQRSLLGPWMLARGHHLAPLGCI